MSTTRRRVTAEDRVSEVLGLDESLVEVFVRHAPHFAKLRNRAMRKVMARLVTVEQAARTASVPADRLVRDLNAALGLAEDEPAVAPVSPAANAPVLQDRHPENAPVVEVDVRDDLRSGREPFSRIMAAVTALKGGEVLRLRAIFEPAPLFGVLGKRGFAHESQAHGADDWSVWFWRPSAPAVAAGNDGASPASDDTVPPDDEHTRYLDVRGLNPPEPMMRTLAALESLAAGRALVQVNQRVPQFLLPMLAERGFAWEIIDMRPDRVLVRISRAP